MKRSWPVVVLLIALGGLVPVATAADDNGGPPPPPPRFTHGVASGDVTPTRAILWTRVNRQALLEVEVSQTSTFATVDFRQRVLATAANDFTVKVDARGLRRGTRYFYRFRSVCEDDDDLTASDDDDCPPTVVSRTGRFETAPNAARPATVRFAYTGDSDGTRANRPPDRGNFEVLDRIREENLDFWSYLGDTIYSDSGLRPGGPATTLDEYRATYKENRTYPALRNLLGVTSTYAQPDDHEVQNDYDGQTVDPARYAAGMEAFREYMPIRTSVLPSDPTCAGGKPIYRKFDWGSEVDLIIPDQRSCRSASAEPQCTTDPPGPFGPLDPAPTAPQPLRTAFGLGPPPPGCVEEINDPSRTFIGPVQKQKLKNDLLNSTAKFKIVFSQLGIQQWYALPYDRWEGYAAERNEIIDFIRDNNIEGVLFLTTDVHATMINQVFIDRQNDPEPVFDEAITGPISTNTYATEILEFGGPTALAGVNALLTIVGEDCRNLDQFSYGSVTAAPASSTPAIAFRTDTGAPVPNEGPTGGPICVYPPVPPVP